MDRQQVLEELVRAWVEVELPGQSTVADQAVELVNAVYESGHSAQAACRQAGAFIDRRVQHPADPGKDSHAMALVAR